MRHLALYGLKFPPFRPDLPTEAFYVTQAVDTFLRRVELGITDGGFSLLTGDPGTGKTIALACSKAGSGPCPTSWSAPSSTLGVAPATSIASSAISLASPSQSTIAGAASRPFAPAGVTTSPRP